MSSRRKHYLSLFALVFGGVPLQPGLRAQVPLPYVSSVKNSADYGTTIAQGSLFVVFGYWLGPEKLVQISSLPLPNVLSGTSVTVTSGSTILNCPMIYTSLEQVAAILPSSVPAGTAFITVAVNGKSDPYYSSTQIMVVPSSFGSFTTNSRGMGAGSVTAVDGALKTLANSAKPAETVILWGTGIGPVSGSASVLPTSYPNFPNVQVWVGGQPAQVVYAGRSGCCVGVDQIAFTVPAIAGGCNVPVTVVSGGVASNTVTLPVSAAGGACTNTGPTLPTAFLNKAVAGQAVKVAAIAMGPEVIGRRESAQSFARSLSQALHTPVSEKEAEGLMSAYAAGSGRALRLAMGKYSSKWKALDKPSKVRLMAQIEQTRQGLVAMFGNVSREGLIVSLGSAVLPVAGSCVAQTGDFPSDLRASQAGLDAGSYLLLTGAAGAFTMKESNAGLYHSEFGPAALGENIPLGTYTISGTGGRDVGAFTASMSVASHLAISNKASLATADRTKPLVVNWTGGVAGSYILIAGSSPYSYAGGVYTPDAHFACVEDGGKGTFTVPSYIMSSMNPTDSGKGSVVISPHPLSNQIAIPGIDLAYFIDGSSDSANVTFK